MVVRSEPDGGMLVDSPDGVSSPTEGSPRDFRSIDSPPLGELGPAVAESHRSGEDAARRNKTTEDPQRNRPGTPLLGGRGQRQSIADFAGVDGIGQAPLQQPQLRPGDATTGKGSPLWGQGGLLSPWRVRLLLMMTFMVTVRTQGCWGHSRLALSACFCYQSLDYAERGSDARAVLRTEILLSTCATECSHTPC